eukprot:CAMPEP_0118698052 /NCGR_PEP_ID=MMETSP0800-20121206/14949_1 /TAXON_ID=210618 ORGANISM="Striatella unipunctata, Strain CCMP2910" /NCGR_SAMPLE_ID=MMETSP0800 /ASSEMBLY_ACC=CAM_ASM_000638 /LENGTH=221 /DNA_ID=CAMNT_0006597755 /DNA_START=250 /DNA_END=915 /DNA_ORIENTATION=-
MSYLDRFLMTGYGLSALQNRKRYQLASMTALYTSIKINEPEVMDPNLLASISKGAITSNDIVIMEREMLKALEWRMQPPTAAAFCRLFVSLLQEEGLCNEALQRILDYAIFQTELAVKDGRLVAIAPSTVAFAAIANAVGDLGLGPMLDFAQTAVEICSINVEVCVSVRRRLMDSTMMNNISISSFCSPTVQDGMTLHLKPVCSTGNCQDSPSSVIDAMQQ